MDTLTDQFYSLIHQLTQAMVDHYMSLGTQAFTPHNLSSFFNSHEFITIWNNISDVVNNINVVRDRLTDIYRTIEVSYPDSISEFDLERTLVQIDRVVTTFNGDTLDIMTY
jgi:hypothetical protein